MWWYIIQPEKEGNTATCCNMDGYDAQERKQTRRPHAVRFHGGAVSSRARPRQKEVSGPQHWGRAQWGYVLIDFFFHEVEEGGNSGDGGMALLIH